MLIDIIIAYSKFYNSTIIYLVVLMWLISLCCSIHFDLTHLFQSINCSKFAHRYDIYDLFLFFHLNLTK